LIFLHEYQVIYDQIDPENILILKENQIKIEGFCFSQTKNFF
jgi:hypothetical protein